MFVIRIKDPHTFSEKACWYLCSSSLFCLTWETMQLVHLLWEVLELFSETQCSHHLLHCSPVNEIGERADGDWFGVKNHIPLSFKTELGCCWGHRGRISMHPNKPIQNGKGLVTASRRSWWGPGSTSRKLNVLFWILTREMAIVLSGARLCRDTERPTPGWTASTMLLAGTSCNPANFWASSTLKWLHDYRELRPTYKAGLVLGCSALDPSSGA